METKITCAYVLCSASVHLMGILLIKGDDNSHAITYIIVTKNLFILALYFQKKGIQLLIECPVRYVKLQYFAAYASV